LTVYDHVVDLEALGVAAGAVVAFWWLVP